MEEYKSDFDSNIVIKLIRNGADVYFGENGGRFTDLHRDLCGFAIGFEFVALAGDAKICGASAV